MNEEVPRVFVSYSHDSPEHKQWVAELCSRLRHDGVDVILDQWDLSLGDDITRFMEDGLARSDRVLLICTQNYVRKADAGVGGVAYERMIVTAEIVRDLGTQKFIPIVRQGTQTPQLPRFLGARFYVNLGSDAELEDQYETLLRELHKQPAVQKPALGKSPFARQASGREVARHETMFLPLSEALADGKDVNEVYSTALEIARQGDLVAWRRLVKDVRSRLPGSLRKWREERGGTQVRTKKDLPRVLDEAVSIYAPLFVVALAGVQSGREKFKDQRGVVDELVAPGGWSEGGNSAIIRTPSGLVFVFQALYGAASLDTDQLGEAVRLALMSLSTRRGLEERQLVRNTHVTGWPEALGEDCTVAWEFLLRAPERWPWLIAVFSLAEDYRVALCAYYMSLHILELAHIIASGKADALLEPRVRMDVPPSFLVGSDEVSSKAYRLLLRSQPSQIWEALDVSLDDMKKFWPQWLSHTVTWLENVYHCFLRSGIVHEHIFDDL